MERIQLQKRTEKRNAKSNNEVDENQKQPKENSAKHTCVPSSYCGDNNFWYPDATPGCSFWPSPPRPNYEEKQDQSEASGQGSQTPLEQTNKSHKNDAKSKTQLKQNVEGSPAEDALLYSWMDEYIISGFRADIAMLSAECADIDEDSDDDIYNDDGGDQNQK